MKFSIFLWSALYKGMEEEKEREEICMISCTCCSFATMDWGLDKGWDLPDVYDLVLFEGYGLRVW